MKDIMNIAYFYGDNPLFVITTNHLAAVGIHYLMNIQTYYDPFSKG